MTTDPKDHTVGHDLARVATSDEKHSVNEKTDKGLTSPSDDFIVNSEGVTHEELRTLRNVADRLPPTAWLVIVVEFAERWSYYGTANIFNNYIRAPLPPGSTTGAVDAAHRGIGVAGALGKGQEISFAIRTFNSFWVYVTPILGGILADTILNRYNTILVFSVVCLFGHITLTATSIPASLANPNGAFAGLIVSILIIGVGAGCIKANVSPMIAEQYTGKLRKEVLPSGEVVIKSPSITIQSIYMWFYAAINVGAACSISASFLARDQGFWAAYLLPTCIFLLVPAVLLIGKKHYVITPPRSSILLEVWRVFKMAARGKWTFNPVKLYKTFRADDFWDPAKPSSYTVETRSKNITWDDEFVAEVARTAAVCKVFLWSPIFWLCYSQIDGNYGTMAAAMTLNGTPNDLIQNLNPISIIILIPIFDYIIYPFLRRKGINFSPVKRVSTGFIFVGLSMVYAGVLQHYIYKMSPCHDNFPSECTDKDGFPLAAPINVWVIAGPYILVGIGEIFASITALEYAFTKAPKRMKSVIMAVAQFQIAVASALNFILVPANREDRFGWLFGSFAIAAFVAGALFMWTFRDLDKAEADLNEIGRGDRAGFVDEHPIENSA